MQKILFYPKDDLVKELVPAPQPVAVPSWFKSIPLHYNTENTLVVERGIPNYTVKTCIPFLDTFSTGYTFNLWCDVQIRTVDGGPRVTWGSQLPELSPVEYAEKTLNRTDLPFITSSGVMDTDGWGVWGNQPFAIKRDWEGVIPAGTPIIQFIPFKRESWTSGIDESLTQWAKIENQKRTSKFRGYYKDKYWNRKKFE